MNVLCPVNTKDSLTIAAFHSPKEFSDIFEDVLTDVPSQLDYINSYYNLQFELPQISSPANFDSFDHMPNENAIVIPKTVQKFKCIAFEPFTVNKIIGLLGSTNFVDPC